MLKKEVMMYDYESYAVNVALLEYKYIEDQIFKIKGYSGEPIIDMWYWIMPYVSDVTMNFPGMKEFLIELVMQDIDSRGELVQKYLKDLCFRCGTHAPDVPDDQHGFMHVCLSCDTEMYTCNKCSYVRFSSHDDNCSEKNKLTK